MACITLRLPAEEAELLFNAVEKMRQAIRRDRSCEVAENVSAETPATETGAVLNVSAETSATEAGEAINVSAETFSAERDATEVDSQDMLFDPLPTFA